MIKKILMGLGALFLVIIVAIGGFLIYINVKPQKYEPQTNLNAPIEIPDSNIAKYSEDISDDKPMVAMFYVDWCTYCRRYMPIFGEISAKYKDKFNFVVVNCEYPENKSIVEKFHIMGFPTLFIIDKKLNHSFTMNMAATTDKKIMTKELDDYMSFRNKIVN